MSHDFLRIFQGVRCFDECCSSLEITLHEIRSVRGKLIRIAQRAWYPQEYRRVSEGENIVEGKLLNLNPFLYEDGLMRIGGSWLMR